MAKVTAPLLGFGASGQIGKTQVYGSWKGVPYARRHVIPANPQTDSQTKTRGAFAFLNAVYKLLAAEAKLPWLAAAKGRPLTDRNAFIKRNLSPLRGTDGDPAADLSGGAFSPGVNGGIPAAAIATADATGQIVTITLTAPALPAGWAITRAQCVAIKQQEADTATVYTTYYAEDVAAPYAPAPHVLVAGTYACYGWFEFSKPDGSLAYGPSLYHAQVIA